MLSLQKIGFFNPGRLSDSEIEQTFIARLPFFEFLLKKIVVEKPNTIPQHYLVIGQRGMGKSSLLMRIAAELRKPTYKGSFIPLSFPEEQYNLDRLSKFWLNCLDALADSLDKEEATEDIAALDKEIANISRSQKATDAMAVYAIFENWIARLERRPVLLVDNLNLIFSKLTKDEQHQLRAILISRNAPILVGASASVIDETLDYDQPFYDAFHIQYLKKLDFRESIEVLVNLAKLTGNTRFEKSIFGNEGRLQALYQLTGGAPRTIAILFPLVQEGFSEDIQTDLDALLDIITPLYKARFDELPEQLQVVMDAVALHWDPINLEQLRDTTLLENPQLSPQLKRLVDMGWLQRLEAFQAKGGAYELTERFFNIWYLMRRSSRRQKKELYLLTRFLEAFYGNNLRDLAMIRLQSQNEKPDQIALDLALADALHEDEISKMLKERSYKQLLDLSFNNRDILDRFTVPEDIRDLRISDLLDQLQDAVDSNENNRIDEISRKLAVIGDKSPLYWQRIGDSFLNAGRDLEAEKIFKKTIKLNENSRDAWNSLAFLYATRLNKYSEAEQALLKCLEQDTQDFSSWYNLGILYGSKLNDHARAENAFLNAIKVGDGGIDVRIALGRSLFELERYTEAEKYFTEACQLDDKALAPLNELGRVYLHGLREYGKAELIIKKAIALSDHSYQLWANLARLYHIGLKDYNQAETAYLKAIELDNTDSSIWEYLGELYLANLQKVDLAEHAYKRALELDPLSAGSWFGLGIIYHTIYRNYPDAIQAFRKAIEIVPNSAFLWQALGSLYHNDLNDFQLSEEAYTTALSIDENNTYSLHELGHLYQDQLGKYQEAGKLYERILALNPDDRPAKYNLIFLLRDKFGKLAEARERFTALEGSDEVDDSHMLNKSLFAYYDKNRGIAENFLKEALILTGNTLPDHSIYGWYRFAAVIIKLGFTDSVLQVFIDTGYDLIYKPFFIAIKALSEKQSDLFLNSVAAEVREPASAIMKLIEKL